MNDEDRIEAPTDVGAAGASTEADYPSGFFARFDTSKDWEHLTLGGHRPDVAGPSAGSDSWVAYFTQDGLVVQVTSQGVSRADFLRFASGIRVDVTG